MPEKVKRNPVVDLTDDEKREIINQRRKTIQVELYNLQLNLATAEKCGEDHKIPEIRGQIEQFTTALRIHDQELASLGDVSGS